MEPSGKAILTLDIKPMFEFRTPSNTPEFVIFCITKKPFAFVVIFKLDEELFSKFGLIGFISRVELMGILSLGLTEFPLLMVNLIYYFIKDFTMTS